jgi:co-chaperonin GroES (HSP10)
MLNGWVLCEPLPSEEEQVYESAKKSGLWVPEQKQVTDRYGIIRYLGEPCMEYEDGKECGEDSDYYQVGDSVMFSMDYNRRLEQSELHKWFDGKTYIVTRRRNLLGIVEFEKDRE